MPRILNDTKRDHVLPDGLRLGPGEHEVPAPAWELALQNETVREWVRSGALQDVTIELPASPATPAPSAEELPASPAATTDTPSKGAKAKK